MIMMVSSWVITGVIRVDREMSIRHLCDNKVRYLSTPLHTVGERVGLALGSGGINIPGISISANCRDPEVSTLTSKVILYSKKAAPWLWK